MKKLLYAAIAGGLIAAAAVTWLAFLPNTLGDEPAGIRLPSDVTFDSMLDSLEASGALASRTSLELFGNTTGWADQVKTGYYEIEPNTNNWTLMNKIRKGLQDDFRITVPGGLTPERFGRVLERQLGTDSAAVVQALRDPELAEQLDTTPALILGRMRANTYDIRWTDDARRAVSRLKAKSDEFWTDARRAQADALGLTPDEVITMASIVQWEAQKPEERPTIAGVYLNRLLGRTSSGTMRLQADPTVQYALMESDGGPMRRLLFSDYAFDHPYNTYQIDGLPPGPINNPSDDAIEAVLAGGEGDYLYFVADGTGGHDFSRTVSEHNEKARRWSQWLSEQIRIRNQREAAEASGQPAPSE